MDRAKLEEIRERQREFYENGIPRTFGGYEGCRDIMVLLERVEELEAENERLREILGDVLTEWADPYGTKDGNSIYRRAFEELGRDFGAEV